MRDDERQARATASAMLCGILTRMKIDGEKFEKAREPIIDRPCVIRTNSRSCVWR